MIAFIVIGILGVWFLLVTFFGSVTLHDLHTDSKVTWNPLFHKLHRKTNVLRLPKMIPDEECKRLMAWVDSLEIQELQELEKIYKGFQPVSKREE